MTSDSCSKIPWGGKEADFPPPAPEPPTLRTYDAKMNRRTYFGKDENLPLRYAYFHVHFNLKVIFGMHAPVPRHEIFHLWVSPSKERRIS